MLVECGIKTFSVVSVWEDKVLEGMVVMLHNNVNVLDVTELYL